MDVLHKVWIIALAFILHTNMSFQECGERFIDEDVSRSRRIIGGHEAAMNSWPWLVNFVDSSNKSFQVCAGNLIDPYWILTTAHCFISNRTKYAVDDWTYIAGDHHLRKADPYEQVLYPEELYIHPKYVLMTDYSPGDYDIALIRLKTPATITRQVRTICLPNDTQDDIENKTHFVAGWGNTRDTPVYTRSHVLKELRMNIVAQQTCNRSYGGKITQRQMCAAHLGGGQDACFGDSGGALQYMNEHGKWVISGTVSWGRGCARKHLYGVYTNVKVLLPYIERILTGSKTCGVRAKRTSRPKRIVGGTEASMNAWPWAVNMLWKGTKRQTCGGTIIASNWILTAAHCFLDKGREIDLEEFEYLVGDHVLREIDKGQKRVIPYLSYIHPDYIPPTLKHPGNFDVCLIRLKYSLEWSDVATPICLPDRPNKAPAGDLRCFAVGWGNIEDKLEYQRPRALKQLRVNVVPFDKCNSNISYNGRVPETFFCAGFREGRNDSCYGDSGGPLQCDNGNGTWSLRGLVSWGEGCARPNKFGVYSNVSKLLPFINKIMSGDDILVRRIEKMSVGDIYKQKPSTQSFLQFCSLSMFSIIQFFHPNVTTIDIVRSWAFQPSFVNMLKVASPQDAAVVFHWNVKNTCKSKTFEQIFVAIYRYVHISENNDTLRKVSERLNITVDEMAFFLRRTVGSLLLMPTIKTSALEEGVKEGKVVEAKVTRLIELVAFLKTIQSGTKIPEHKLKEIVRSYSFGIARNLTDESLRRIISTNHIDVFTKYVELKNLGLFFGNLSLGYLKKMCLSDIVVHLIGIKLEDFVRQFAASMDVEEYVYNKIIELEMYWNISTNKLTLENLLTASKLMEDGYNCNNCDARSEDYVPGCKIVCVRCTSKKCDSPVEGPQVSHIKLALVFGVFSGCLVAFIIILLICFISKQHRSRNPSASEKVMTDDEMTKSNESLAYKSASNNNIVFLPQNRAVNGKSGSYVALECHDQEKNKCNGNLESIL